MLLPQFEIRLGGRIPTLLNWTQTGWGEGDLSIDLDLDVNAPLGLDPLGTDTDEEITIDVYIVMFKPNISKIE